MPSRPPPTRGPAGAAHGPRVVRRVPLAMAVALEVVSQLRARQRDSMTKLTPDALQIWLDLQSSRDPSSRHDDEAPER